MFVGYAMNHMPDVYRMWDPFSNRVHTTRDVIWLKCMFFEKRQFRPELITHPDVSLEAGESDSDDEVPTATTDAKDSTDDDTDAKDKTVDNENNEDNDIMIMKLLESKLIKLIVMILTMMMTILS